MAEISSFDENLRRLMVSYCERYPSLDEAYRSYVGQYGDAAVKVHQPILISDTIDPVIIILGRNTPIFYRDSRRSLQGSLDSVEIKPGALYIIGRREPPNSKLVVWGPSDETEISEYDSRVLVFPSRIHCAIYALDARRVLFSDLGSTSGTVVTGETKKPEPLVAVYATRSLQILRIPIKGKYGR